MASSVASQSLQGSIFMATGKRGQLPSTISFQISKVHNFPGISSYPHASFGAEFVKKFFAWLVPSGIGYYIASDAYAKSRIINIINRNFYKL
jgi:hypothetical protein